MQDQRDTIQARKIRISLHEMENIVCFIRLYDLEVSWGTFNCKIGTKRKLDQFNKTRMSCWAWEKEQDPTCSIWELTQKQIWTHTLRNYISSLWQAELQFQNFWHAQQQNKRLSDEQPHKGVLSEVHSIPLAYNSNRTCEQDAVEEFELVNIGIYNSLSLLSAVHLVRCLPRIAYCIGLSWGPRSMRLPPWSCAVQQKWNSAWVSLVHYG